MGNQQTEVKTVSFIIDKLIGESDIRSVEQTVC